MPMERAERMFRAYNEQGALYKTHDGRVVPPWSELSEEVKNKWRAAANEPMFCDDEIEVDPLFGVVMLNDIGKRQARMIANAFHELLVQLKHMVPEGRSLALCKTALEEACFHAKKGMAHAPGNHE